MSQHHQDYERQLKWRLKQIEIGKSAEVYSVYAASVPRSGRRREDPQTPDPYDARMSKRQFEGRVKAWKRQLNSCYWGHDPEPNQDPELTYSKLRCNFFLTSEEVEMMPHLAGNEQVNIIIPRTIDLQ